MTRSILLAVLASVLLSSLAQVALKAGVKQPGVGEALAGQGAMAVVLSIASSPMVWVGLGIYGASTLLWLLVLARVDVSLAYPFVGLGFVVTMLLGWLVHGEALSPARIVGTLMIVAGVIVLGRS